MPGLPLFLLVALLPFCDFLQNGFVAFAGAPVMGGIAAGPEAYSLVATLYAGVAILAIALHRRLVVLLGWRSYLQLSSALFGAGALVCAASGSLAMFTAGRLLTAAGCASFLSAARVLVQRVPPSPRRFVGVRFFAAGLAWGAVAGPVLASAALALGDWRDGFRALALVAAAIGVLASFVLDDRPVDAAAPPASLREVAGLLALVAGSFLLLQAARRSAFDFFADPRLLYGAAAIAVPALALFVRNNATGSPALLAMRRIAQRRYLAGLAVFCAIYVVLGADNTVLPVLMQRALDLPLQTTAAQVGLGALAGVASWIVLARLLPRQPGPTRYYVFGFGLLLLCALQLSSLSEGVDVQQSVLPALVCHGAFVVVVLSTTAMQTFQALQQDDTTFSHANQVKNMLAQFGLAFGGAAATLVLQWRATLHFGNLAESVSLSSTGLQDWLARMTQHFATTHDPVLAGRMAWAQLAVEVGHEAMFLAVLDYFRALAWLAAGAIVLAVALAGRARMSLAWRAAATGARAVTVFAEAPAAIHGLEDRAGYDGR